MEKLRVYGDGVLVVDVKLLDEAKETIAQLKDKLDEITKIANGPVVYKAGPDSKHADALLKLVQILVVLEEESSVASNDESTIRIYAE